MKTIRDAVHGNISFSKPELGVLDAPALQRLRNIKQLSFSYFVYPSATHTRFEHSLGTFYLAGELAENLGLGNSDRKNLKLAALLHDIGHGPFSHTSEDIIKAHIGEEGGHEERTVNLIRKTELADRIKDACFSPATIAKIATGQTYLGDMISGEVDVDRMDYLVRDSYYTGAAYGEIDLERMIHVLELHRRKLVINEDGLSVAESMVRGRYLMYPTVYEHHATRIINSMFISAVLSRLREHAFTVDQLYAMDDIDLIAKLRSHGDEMMQRIDQRRLYKRAAVLDIDDFGRPPKKLLNLNSQKLNALEIELTETCGLTEGEVLLDIPPPLYPHEAGATIMQKGKPTPLAEVSPLVKALMGGQWTYWNVGVYCAGKNVKMVGKVARELLLGWC